ncbi:MFS transporter [Saccharopolyspora taberi]|uniref:MFS transporter n=1 Tax=Saccharopolyspora taberi TaxID=60895 RepID=A0ABN3VET2_9PSEU
MSVLPERRDQLLAAFVTAGSVFGDTAAQSALVLEFHDTASQPSWAITALLMAAAVPAAIVFPFVGAVADRFDSRHLMTVSAAASASCCLGLAAADSFWGVLLLVALLSVLASVGTTTLNALMPALARPGRLASVMAVQRGAALMGATAGLSLGGVLSGAFGTDVVLLLDSASFALLGAGCAAIRTRRRAGTLACKGPRAARASRRPDASAKRFWSAHPLLLTATVSSGAVSLFATTTNVVQVFFVKDVVGTDDAGYGLVSACWMAGMVVAVPLAGRVPDRLRPLVAMTIACESATGLVFLVCSAWPTVPVTAACYVAGGLASSGVIIARGTLVQLLSREESRGRVQAAAGAARRFAGAAALALGAVSLEIFGARGTFAFAGLGSVVISAVCGLRLAVVLQRASAEPAAAHPIPARRERL